MPKITRLILHNTNRREWCGYASLLRPSVPSRVNTLTTVRLVPISRSLAPYSRTADVVCWHRRFEKLFVYKGTQKSASQKPQLELLTDAETCHNLHSLCSDENNRVKSSKALVLALCVIVWFCHIFSFPFFIRDGFALKFESKNEALTSKNEALTKAKFE